MATLEQETDARTALKKVLKDISDLTPTALARLELGSDLSFESGVLFFSRTIRLFGTLNESDLMDVPHQKLNQLLQVANETLSHFRQIQDFSLLKYQNNPVATRDQFIGQIRDNYDRMFEIAGPVVAFTIKSGVDFARLEEQARKAIIVIDQESDAHRKAMAATKEAADTVVSEVRRVAQEAGVSQHAIHFKQEADSYEAAAGQWLEGPIEPIGIMLWSTVTAKMHLLLSRRSQRRLVTIRLGMPCCYKQHNVSLRLSRQDMFRQSPMAIQPRRY